MFTAGCGGGGGGETSTPTSQNTQPPINTISTPKIGYLIDSAVEGIDYTCGTLTGVTDSNGKFLYDIGKCPNGVEFKLGSLLLGSINPSMINSDTYLTIQELAGKTRNDFTDETVQKMAVLLQSLDDDNNADNGIVITQNIKNAFTLDGSIKDKTDTQISDEITKATINKHVISKDSALSHLKKFTQGANIIEDNLKNTVPLKKTGQTTSYTPFDDGYYQTGVTPSYTRDNTKEIVTDNITGLMWQDNSEAKTLILKLTVAKDYCDYSTLGGYNNWRLPSIEELEDIVDFGRNNPSIDPTFNNVAISTYWSSSESASFYNWAVIFDKGNTVFHSYDYNNNAFIRCVRDAQK